jgi:FkbM family methyltransferase
MPKNRFLGKIRGVIHIGANDGDERDLYAAFGLRVLWIEPIPEVFETLARNISAFPSQRAVKYLVTAEDGKECQFHIANHGGQSSSILELSKHKDMFPDVFYTQTITLSGNRLGTLLDREGIDISQYEGLILDTQGTECDILRGASGIISRFRYVSVEVPNFEAYENCCQIGELAAFMSESGFREHYRRCFKHKDGVGTYFEVLYRRD